MSYSATSVWSWLIFYKHVRTHVHYKSSILNNITTLEANQEMGTFSSTLVATSIPEPEFDAAATTPQRQQPGIRVAERLSQYYAESKGWLTLTCSGMRTVCSVSGEHHQGRDLNRRNTTIWLVNRRNNEEGILSDPQRIDDIITRDRSHATSDITCSSNCHLSSHMTTTGQHAAPPLIDHESIGMNPPDPFTISIRRPAPTIVPCKPMG